MFACLPFCHALFLGGFHWFSVAFAPWLRDVCKVADGSVVFVCVFGVGIWEGIVGLCLVVVCHVWSHGVFGTESWGIWGWF